MSREHSDSSRLDALETLAAHQDRIITELNDAITAQWRKIDALERQVANPENSRLGGGCSLTHWNLVGSGC